MNSPLDDKSIKEARSLIADTRLPHPSNPFPDAFVTEALNPQFAAEYILRKCRRSDVESRKADLFQFVSDWTYIVESSSFAPYILRFVQLIILVSEYGTTTPTPDLVTRTAIAKRDGEKGCITGNIGSFGDSLFVASILPVPSRWTEDNPRIFEMLGAFFTPSYRDWWLAYVREPENMSSYRNHWLVRKSAVHEFAKGFIKLDRLHPSLIEYQANHVFLGMLHQPLGLNGSFPLLGDHSRMMIEKIDPRFVGTHARLSLSIRWLDIAKQISINKKSHPSASLWAPRPTHLTTDRKPGHQSSLSVTGFLKTACLVFWRMVPDRIRVAVYKVLQKVGYKIYGKPDSSALVQRLPFGLYLKHSGDPEGFRNEFNALKMIRQYTSNPVPRPLDCVSLPAKSSDQFYSRDAYLLTTRIPGIPLAMCSQVLSDDDGAEFTTKMNEYITQLRAIPKTISPEFAICNTLGEACRDPRIRNANPIGPFVNEAAFSQLLRYPDEPSRRGHRIVFTHADLNLRNVLVDQGLRPDGTRGWMVTGIVDWENSGYYPEYWDYTKALFEVFRYSQRWRDLIHEIFKLFGDLSKEFEVEEKSWGEGDGI